MKKLTILTLCFCIWATPVFGVTSYELEREYQLNRTDISKEERLKNADAAYDRYQNNSNSNVGGFKGLIIIVLIVLSGIAIIVNRNERIKEGIMSKPKIISVTYGYYLDAKLMEKILNQDIQKTPTLSYKLEKIAGVTSVFYPHNELGIEITLLEHKDINKDYLWGKITSIINNHIKEEV